MGIFESIGLFVIVFTSLSGVAAVSYFTWRGVKQHLKEARLGRMSAELIAEDTLRVRR